MSLTIADLNKIAHLARLDIPEDQLQALNKDLDNILKLVSEMEKVDTREVVGISHPLNETQPLRIDQVTEINQRELFQTLAPQTNAGLYIVPQVIETE